MVMYVLIETTCSWWWLLPYKNYEYDEIEKGNNFNCDVATVYLLSDQTFIIPTPFTIGIIHPIIQIIQYVSNHVIFLINRETIVRQTNMTYL